jgi:15-cis-phytoene desaturase
MTTVVVLGGGMAGLSAAFELAERGFQVSVYEKLPVCGGKARSFGYENSGTGGRPDLPAEHGFRFFPGFYRHVYDTMSRIPLDGGTVADNLMDAPEITIAQEGKAPYTFPSTVPTTVEEFIVLLKAAYQHHLLNVPSDEAWFFIRQLVCFLGSSTERRLKEYENIRWWKYIDAQNKSAEYQKICARGITLSLVAMRPEDASTLTVGTILVQILWNMLDASQQSDRVLNGPTSDVWITPWANQLQGMGVTFHNSAEVLSFQSSGSAITGVRIRENGSETTVTGDYYIVALPVEVTRTLMSAAQKAAAGIDGIDNLRVAWMTGAMFYTNRIVKMAEGHVIYADSPWAVTSIEQRQFWSNDFDLPQYGNGQVVDILSSVISVWDTPGDKVFFKPANEAQNADTILDEVWEQLKAHRTLAGGGGSLNDADVEDRLLDPAITWNGGINNAEPLLINIVSSRQHRPPAATNFPNLFIAGDYVLTYTDLATMEAANEAGRHAARGIIDASGAATTKPQIWPLDEPPFFAFWKDLDRIKYRWFGADSDPPICDFFDLLRDTLDTFEQIAVERREDSPIDELFRRMEERAEKRRYGGKSGGDELK